MIGGYKVITLCGSSRFKDAFIQVQKRLTLEGNIVLSLGLFGHSGDTEVWKGMDEGTITKTKMKLNMRKLMERKFHTICHIMKIKNRRSFGSSFFYLFFF